MIGLKQGVGFHGKIPSMGDFVTRRLQTTLIDRWDDWMQLCMDFCKRNINDQWNETYMVGPVWRFFFQSGIVGDEAVCGIFFPSVDRVGRYFPFAMFAPLSGNVVASSIIEQDAWFDRMEALAMEVLNPSLDFSAWDNAMELEPLPILDAASAVEEDATVPQKAANIGPLARITLPRGPLLKPLIDWHVSALSPPHSIWWKRDNNEEVQSLAIADGLPDASAFPAFFCEDWEHWGWTEKSYISGA